MRLTELSLKNPAAITSAALVISLFGTLALLRLPIQLLPDTRQPQLWINAQWREAAPNEVEERPGREHRGAHGDRLPRQGEREHEAAGDPEYRDGDAAPSTLLAGSSAQLTATMSVASAAT